MADDDCRADQAISLDLHEELGGQLPHFDAPGSHYIPDMCRELGLPYVSLLGLMRREKWAL